jgi:hypothetical protein
LGEHAAEFGFARVCRLAIHLAFATLGLFLHYRRPGAVHLDIQNGHGFADHHRQIQLDGSLNLLLLLVRDIGADRFGGAFHRFGGNFQTGQQSELLAAVIERSLLTYQRLHAAHAGRELCILNVEFDIGWKLTRVTVCAQVIGPRYSHLAYGAENRLGAQSHVVGLMAATTSQVAPIDGWFGELQQLRERYRSCMVHATAQRHLHRLQIRAPAVVTFGEDAPQQGRHFPRDLRLDRLRGSFSSGVSVSSTGRNAQILSLTSTSSLQSS